MRPARGRDRGRGAIGLRDGDRHDPHDLPIVLCGRANGKIPTGDDLRLRAGTPLTNRCVTMLRAFVSETERVADSTGAIDEILVRATAGYDA